MNPATESQHFITQPARRSRQTPVLLVHGAWHGAWCWKDCAGRFAALGYEVHTISLPGHGDPGSSAASMRRYRISDYVDCLTETIAAVKPTPAVVAHSLGGGVLQRYLARHRLPAAVLLASIPVGGTLGASIRWLRRRPGPTLRHLFLWDGKALVATPELVAEAFLSSHSPVDAAALHARLGSESVRALMRMTVLPGFRPKHCHTPMMVAAAELDTIFTLDEARKTAEQYRAELVVFEDQGHDLMLEPGWRKVVDRIDRFLIDRAGVS